MTATATRLEVAERVRVVIGVFKGRIGIVTRCRTKSFSSYSVNVRFPDSDVDVAFRPDELETI